MLTDRGWDAMTMLDFSEGRTYEIAPDTNVSIRPSDVELALKNTLSESAPPRTETQRFIIDRYDRSFFVVSQLQVAVRSGLGRKDFPVINGGASAALLCWIFFYFSFVGAGPWSLDALIASRRGRVPR